MLNARSLLDQLTGGQGLKGAADTALDKARSTWDDQSTLGKGAIAGGLLGLLLTGGGRRLIGTGFKVGGAALIGGLAYKAYEDWKAGRDPAAVAPAGQPGELPAPTDPGFAPEGEAAEALARKLVQAMIAAARADGHVTEEERRQIDAALERLGPEDAAAALLRAELDAPLDVRRIAALATTEAEAAEIYTASLLVAGEQTLEEKGYLAMLAAALNLDDGLVKHLQARAASLG